MTFRRLAFETNWRREHSKLRGPAPSGGTAIASLRASFAEHAERQARALTVAALKDANALERKTDGKDPAVIVLMERRDRDLHACAEAQMQRTRQRVWADDDTGRYEDLLIAAEWTVQPER